MGELLMLGESYWIDVSHHQGVIDWAAVQADGVEGAIVRIGDGTIGKDRQYENNVSGAANNGIFVAVYYFWYDHLSPEYQFGLIRQILGDRVPSVLFIDVEDYSYQSAGMSREERTRRLMALTDQLTDVGYRIGYYTAQWTWDTHILDTGNWDSYIQWPAYWPSDPEATLTIPQPAGWNNWEIWQYSFRGRISGINGNVDQNRGRHPIAWYEGWHNGEEPLPTKELLLWPCEGRITQHFAVNPQNYPSSEIGHMGTDIGAAVGTPVTAAADGVVEWSGYWAPWGNYVRVLYPEYNFYGFYAHLREPHGTRGDPFSRGDTVGYTGNTGNSTGPHLHYSVRLADADADHDDWDPEDEDPYLGTATNPYGYVDPVLFHGYVNQAGTK